MQILLEESKIDSCGFYDTHTFSKKFSKQHLISNLEIIRKIKKKGYNATISHYNPHAVKSDISYDGFVEVFNDWFDFVFCKKFIKENVLDIE